MKMIVGLGNIGNEYEETRHNIGFMVLDRLARDYNTGFKKQKFEAQLAEIFVHGEKILLVKPMTYMNESGRAVRPLMDYYGIDIEDILIISDDMDMDNGRIRLRKKGSAGGHNGLKSLIKHLKTDQFKRLKIGIGHPKNGTVVSFVLSRFSKKQHQEIEDATIDARAAIENWIITDDFLETMNKYNHK